MMTVREVSRRTGVSVRTLHHYHRIGLLCPSEVSASGYRLYDENALKRLQQILLFRTLEFSLADIRRILDSPDFDEQLALEQQIQLLTLKRDHLDNLIRFARGLKLRGVKNLSFQAFDTRKIDAYADQAKAAWGKTDAWKEFEQKSSGRSRSDDARLAEDMMDIFREFGEIRDQESDSPAAIALAACLQAFISQHFYNCTPQILRSLADMYEGGGDFTRNIDAAGGPGTAAFSAAAIRNYLNESESKS